MLDKASLMSLRPGGMDLGGLTLGPNLGNKANKDNNNKAGNKDGNNKVSSPFAGLALGAKGNVKGGSGNKGGKGKKGKQIDFDLADGGLTSGALGAFAGAGSRGKRGGGGRYEGGGSLAPVAVEDQEGRVIGGKVFGEARVGPIVKFGRAELLQYAEHFTALPSDLEGTSFEVVLQPGDTESREAQIAAMHSKRDEDAGGSAGEADQWRQPAPTGAKPGAGGSSQGAQGSWSQGKQGQGAKAADSAGRQGARPAASAAASHGRVAPGAGTKDSSKIVKASDVGLKAWAPARAASDSERILRQVRGLLNKLTPENFEKLFTKLVESITTAEVLAGSITMLFEKAVAEPMFCSLNAELCLRLSKELPEFPPSGGDTKPMTFRRVLLNTCQEEFEGSLQGLSNEDAEDKDDENSKAKRRMLGNVKLIGNLFTRGVINQKIVLVCVQQLLGGELGVHENCIECACEILSLCAKLLGETPKAVPLVEQYFSKLAELAASPDLSSRVRFIIKDVQELRRANYVPRKEAVTAKTISEIHAEAQAELGIAVMPDSLAKSFAPLSGMVTKEDLVQELLPALRGGDEGWDISGKQQESNYLDGKKTTFSALIGEAPPVPTRQKKTEQKEEDASTSKAPSTPEELEKRTKSTLVEYMSSADIAEAMLCIKEFNCDEGQAAKVVELVIAQLLDNVKENEKNLLLELLVALRTREAVSADALLNGLKAHTATLEDLAIDVPLAPQLIGESIGACVTGGAADLSLLKTILDGCEGCEVKRKFVLVVLLKMRQKGKDVKAELAEHGLDLAVALKADELDPPDLPTVEDFLAKKGLSSLLA